MALGSPIYAPVNFASSGNNLIVAGLAGYSWFVLGYMVMSNASVTVYWTDGVTNLSGPMALQSGSPVSPNELAASSESEGGIFQTSSGNGLYLNLSGNIQVSGHVVYCKRPT
jgi:hypothetical protein